MLNGDERFINSAGLQIWTEHFGNSGDPVVLLIMGTAAQGIGWPDELVEALVDGGRQVVRFDHRDTGRSGTVDFERHPYTLADMTADTLAVLDGYQLPAAHIVGASLGGTIAQLLAVHHPGRVLTLTAIMSGPMGHSPGPAWARALSGQDPDPSDLPPPTQEFLAHVTKLATAPPATSDERSGRRPGDLAHPQRPHPRLRRSGRPPVHRTLLPPRPGPGRRSPPRPGRPAS